MSAKPEALRLAEQLEAIGLRGPVAAELRRLHAEVERLSLNGIHTCRAECQRPVCRLTRERDALLEALRTLLSYAFTLEMRLLDADGEHRAMQQARAAIAKAEGEKT